MKRNKSWMAFALLAFSATAAVAQTRYISTAPGTWKPWHFTAYPDHQKALGARPADVKEVEAQLLRLNAILKKTDGVSNPVGFSVETVGLLESPTRRPGAGAGELALTVRPFPASLNFGAYAVVEYGSGANVKREDTGETAQLLFFVNDLEQPLFSATNNSVPEFAKLDGDVVRLAPPQPDVMGLARYGDTLVLKKSAEPIWAAVTYGETLALVARSIDARLVEERDVVARLQAGLNDAKDPKKRAERLAMYKKIAPMQKDPAYIEKMVKVDTEREKQADAILLPQITSAKAVVTSSEQELADAKAKAAGLSAADKAAPACYSIDKASLERFRRAPAAACDALVRPNWKLFNPALPRSAPQVLTIGHFMGCLNKDAKFIHVGGCVANKRLMESLDKAALLAWLQ
jgi:hypothetical protein